MKKSFLIVILTCSLTISACAGLQPKKNSQPPQVQLDDPNVPTEVRPASHRELEVLWWFFDHALYWASAHIGR